MKRKDRKCDACERTIRESHHELLLTDATTGQRLGRYHAKCQRAAAKYFERGVGVGEN